MSDKHMIGWINVPCEKCGYMNSIRVWHSDAYSTQVYICDMDEGGCGVPFVVQFGAIHIDHKVFRIVEVSNAD